MIINSFVGLLSFSLPLLGNSLVYGSSVLPEENLYRERRDMYGGGGGYGGGYGGGSYGCSCPYASCDNKSDGLLAFGVGALLGLFLSMLRTMMMTTTTTTNTGGNGGRIRRDTLADFQKNVTWADESARFNSQHRSTLTKLLHLPESFSDDVVPMVADLLQIYTDSGKRPECVRRWVCEATQQSIKMGGLRARLGSLSR